MLYFITVNYHCASLVEQALASITKQEHNCRIVIVNNSSDDTAIASFASEQIHVIQSPENLGFGRACNLALQWIYAQDGQALVWIINPDAYLATNAIAELTKILRSHPEISILGTQVYDPHRRVCFKGGKFFPSRGVIIEELEAGLSNHFQESTQSIKSEVQSTAIGAFEVSASLSVLTVEQALPYRPTDWVTACSLVLNFAAFSECPYFDSDYFLYYEDFDFCRRYAQQGYPIYITDLIQVCHQTSSITSRHPQFKVKQEIFSYLLSLEKHAPRFALMRRFIRILGASILQIIYRPTLALAKLQGLQMYVHRTLKKGLK